MVPFCTNVTRVGPFLSMDAGQVPHQIGLVKEKFTASVAHIDFAGVMNSNVSY